MGIKDIDNKILRIASLTNVALHQWRTQEFFFEGGVQQFQLRTERTGIWGRQPPSQGLWRQL